MQRKKRTFFALSFALVALLIATTAFADIANKSGYDQFKDSIKRTAEICSTQLDSFTAEYSMVLKDNGRVLLSENSVNKYDMVNNITETITNSQRLNGRSFSYYSYSDKNTEIRRPDDSEEYYVTTYLEEKEPLQIDNPFTEDEAKDVERIIDALVGGLRDHVQVEEFADGSKEFYGSLNEVQIPALINAITSFQVKQEFSYGRQNDLGFRLTQDIFVKGISGSASFNSDGLMESILGTVTISGKDAEGNTHELTLDLLIRIFDVNSTEIEKPDLTGKKVIKEEGVSRKPYSEKLANPEKYIGSYKNDIIIEKDGRFVKIGERKLEITILNNSQIAGKYTEEYKDGYQEYAANKMEFSFVGNFNDDYRSATLEITDNSGTVQQGNIFIDEYRAKIELYLDRPYHHPLQYDSTFTPDLD